MKIYGTRSDGSLLISIGGGVGVIMRGTHASKATDLGVLQKMGPWKEPDAADMRKVAKQLDKCRTVALTQFHLGVGDGMSFDEQRTRVEQALCSRLGLPTNGGYGPASLSLYVPTNGMGENWVVYCMNGKHYSLGYSIDEDSGDVTFYGQPEEVGVEWETPACRTDLDAKYLPVPENQLVDLRQRLLTLGDRSKYPGGKYPSEVEAEESDAGRAKTERIDRKGDRADEAQKRAAEGPEVRKAERAAKVATEQHVPIAQKALRAAGFTVSSNVRQPGDRIATSTAPKAYESAKSSLEKSGAKKQWERTPKFGGSGDKESAYNTENDATYIITKEGNVVDVRRHY